MPEIESYTFTHRELLELMVKASDVHEGEWMLQVNFGFSAGNIGPNDESVIPGGIVGIQQLGITKAKEGAPKALVVNAAEVNPKPST